MLLSFSHLYKDIIEPIKKYIDEKLKKNKFMDDVDLTQFTQYIEKYVDGEKHGIIKLLKDQFIKELQLISPKPNIDINTDDFILQTYNYLCWLVAHDTETKFIAYFPSLIIPDLPSGGLMMGFRTIPNPKDLMALQDFVDNFFIIKSYLLA